MANQVLTILYDGDCPFCVREMMWLKKKDRRDQLGMRDLADPAFDPGEHGLTRDEAMAQIHAILPDGSVITGMRVFRLAYRAVGLGWLLAPTGWPILRPLFDLGYRTFARHRVRLGRLFGRSCADGTCSPASRPASTDAKG
jgi:predicted DCC family thiol-disulfide oxidoreductase YuxK